MEFFKICLALGLVQLASASTCREGGHCAKPNRDKNFDLDIFKANTDKGTWHMSMGDIVVRSHIAAVLRGELLGVEEDYSHMCGRSKAQKVSKTDSHGNWYGFGDKEASWKCNRTMPGILNCHLSGSGKYEETNLVYISKTDNKHYMVIVMCYRDGQSGWFVLTSSSDVKPSLKEDILDHIQSLGFDRDNVVCLHNEKCDDH